MKFFISTALAALMIAAPVAAKDNNGNNNGPTTIHNNSNANAAAIAAAKAQAKAIAKQQQRQQQKQSQSQSSRNTNKNSNRNTSSSNNSVNIEDRLQAPGLGSFGGGGCPEGFQFSVPGGAAGIQWQCKEGKQAMKAGTVGAYFGNKSTRDYLCDSDKSLYALDHCVTRRIAKSGRIQQRDRANVGR